jgi:hypothetical protein
MAAFQPLQTVVSQIEYPYGRGRRVVGEVIGNSGCAAVAGCLWLMSVLLLAPGIWIGLSYDYSASEWLSLLPFPSESEEFFPWFGRIITLLVLIGSTLFLAAYAIRKGAPLDEQ